MTTANKVPTAAASLKAAQAFINTHKVGDTISGGHLYVALFLLQLINKGSTLEVADQSVTIFKGGKLAAVAGWSKSGILTTLKDAAGNSMVPAGALRVEKIISYASAGKVVEGVNPLFVKGKADRQAVAAGKLPASWA